MKHFIFKMIRIIGFFLTPEDSTNTGSGMISFDVKSGMVGLGSLKAVFWMANALILIYLITVL